MNLEAVSKHRHIMAMPIKKALLMMKLTAILLTVGCLQVAASGHSQNVTLKEENASLKEIFKRIEKQTGFSFWYKADLLSTARKVYVSLKNATLKEALDVCLRGQGFAYTIVDKTVVVSMV